MLSSSNRANAINMRLIEVRKQKLILNEKLNLAWDIEEKIFKHSIFIIFKINFLELLKNEYEGVNDLQIEDTETIDVAEQFLKNLKQLLAETPKRTLGCILFTLLQTLNAI